MLSQRDLDLLRAEERCWPEDEPVEWECSSCGHLNEHEGRVCERCEATVRDKVDEAIRRVNARPRCPGCGLEPCICDLVDEGKSS